MTQLILNIENPNILPILKKLVGVIDGVSIAKPIRKTKTSRKSNDESWLTDEVKQSIARGEDDIANGRYRQMTAKDVRSMLGV